MSDDNIYGFTEHVLAMLSEGKVTTQTAVRIEMMEMGLNPNKTEDVKEYYQTMQDAANWLGFEDDEQVVENTDD